MRFKSCRARRQSLARLSLKRPARRRCSSPSQRNVPPNSARISKAGDILRTNAGGTLAILFADRTQIRLGRNAVLLVKAVQAGVPSKLELQSGALWGRAVRTSTRLSIETPAANAGIRGTSWSVLVEGDRTVLQVYEGRIDFSNQQGNLSIGGGEAAQAQKGEAPTRLVVVNSMSASRCSSTCP